MKNVKALLVLLLVGAGFFVAWKLFPPYVNNYSLKQDLDTMARTYTYAQAATPVAIKADVIAKAKDHDVLLVDENVDVERSATGVNIDIHYTVPVEFPGGKKMELKFAESAGNKLITAK